MTESINEIINKLKNGTATDGALKRILTDEGSSLALFKAADEVRREVYGNKIYIRGLIEFTNYCKNNCFYCGIRRGNEKVRRFRLAKEQILECCELGYNLGFRTFVLQGGEDEYFSDGVLIPIVKEIRDSFPECAITLSLGERSKLSYEKLFTAGADRYLLRHETINHSLYSKLHPKEMSLTDRLRCLRELKEIGFQTGAGFMVGAPNQTVQNIMEEIRFIYDFKPQMIGIGPYIPHADTPFKNYKSGGAEMTARLISIFRLMLPHALIPSTTALATVSPDGRMLGLKAGANVVMPNLSPDFAKDNYMLYANKASSGAECAEGLEALKEEAAKVGYEIVTDRGDYKG